MTDYTGRINTAKAAVEKAKADRIRAEQNKENLEKRLDEIEAEVKVLGVDPVALESTIAKMDADINADLLTIEGMIPASYR